MRIVRSEKGSAMKEIKASNGMSLIRIRGALSMSPGCGLSVDEAVKFFGGLLSLIRETKKG